MKEFSDFQPTASYSDGKIPIHAGKFVGNLKIGADMDEVFHVMNGTGGVSTYQEEYNAFDNYGYTPMEHAQFIIGFDSVWVYNENYRPPYPVFKIYFLEGLVRYISLSSYGEGIYALPKCQNYTTERGLAFGDNIERMLELYGNDYVQYQFGDYDGDFIYPELGISFVFEHDELRNIYLFPANDANIIQKLRAVYVK